jgi:putative transposase
MCSKCGHISPDNRKTQSDFRCVACGYRKNADHNAAMNISKANIGELIKAQLVKQECV